MKILILIAENGWSFVNQASALAKGFNELEIPNKLVRISKNYDAKKTFQEFQPDLVLGVGSWHEYKYFVEEPQSLGYKGIPWLVANGGIEEWVSEYNKLPVFLTTSEYCKEVFTRDGIDPKLIKIIPEAVDTEFWQMLPEKELEEFLRLLSVTHPTVEVLINYDLVEIRKKKIPILFTTGGDATSKGAQEVIKALDKVGKEIPWIYMIKMWPSPGGFQRSIEELTLAKEFGFLDRIRYISGEFSDEFIRGLTSACDIYAAPSRTEGFGLPLVQAQLCGKPVVTVDATATRETIIHGETGFAARQDTSAEGVRADINDLAQYLKRLLTDEKLRQQMGEAGRANARKKFDPKTIASEMVKVLETI